MKVVWPVLTSLRFLFTTRLWDSIPQAGLDLQAFFLGGVIVATMQITYYQSLVQQGVPPELAAQTVAKLDGHIDERINLRLSGIESKFDAIDSRFNAIESKIDSLKWLPVTIIGSFGVIGALVIAAANLFLRH